MVFICLPVLVPWQRRQFSYWLLAGLTVVLPSVALIPITCAWERRTAGAAGKAATRLLVCGLWQSTQVTWRFWFKRAASFERCALLPGEKTCPYLGATVSARMLAVGGDVFELPLWQIRQAWSSGARSREFTPGALCCAWHDE